MENIVITIARQYGSGGKTIGEMLARDLGIHCYNREILKMASEDSGISEKLFGKSDERLDISLLQKLTKKVYSGDLINPESDGFVSKDNLFNYQAKIIKQLARQESCVIIGRCADFVLRNFDNVTSVFVHADREFCLEQAMLRNSMTPKEMEKYITKVDKYTGDFYRHYTGRDWSDARNYDLCLNSGKLGFEKCVEEIKSYLKIRYE